MCGTDSADSAITMPFFNRSLEVALVVFGVLSAGKKGNAIKTESVIGDFSQHACPTELAVSAK